MRSPRVFSPKRFVSSRQSSPRERNPPSPAPAHKTQQPFPPRPENKATGECASLLALKLGCRNTVRHIVADNYLVQSDCDYRVHFTDLLDRETPTLCIGIVARCVTIPNQNEVCPKCHPDDPV